MCGVSECDHGSSIIRRPCPTAGLLRHGKKEIHLVMPRFDVKRDFFRNINGTAIYISYMIFIFILSMGFIGETCR